MKILHFGKYYPPHFGGMEFFLSDLNGEINRRGIVSDVICSSNKITTFEESTSQGARLIRSGTLGEIASTPISPGMIYQARRICDDYDIVHVHLPNPMANLALFFKRTRAKIVIHWHSDIVVQKRLLRYYHPFLIDLLGRSEAIIATSPNYVNGSFYLKEFREKVSIIPLGLDLKRLREPSPYSVRRIKEQYKGKKIIFTVGRLTRYKGFEYLIRAAKSLPGDTIVLIAGEGRLRKEFEDEIRTQGLSEKVYLLGRVSERDIAAYFRACDVFVLPSIERNEAFGVVLLEAMFYSKPVVSTDIPDSGVSWVNRDGESGLVVKRCDPKELTGAIARLSEDNVLYQKLSIGANKRVKEKFNISYVYEKIICLYERVLKERV